MIDVLLAVAVLLAAASACLTTDRTRSAMAFLVFGTLLSLWWAHAGAPDVALAEAALGTGVTGALFIDALTRSRAERENSRSRRSPRLIRRWGRRIALVTVVAAVASGMARAVLAVAVPGDAAQTAADDGAGSAVGLGDLLRAQGERLGAEHEITAVLLHVRAYDTLLEAAVLLAAAVTVFVVSESTRPGPGPSAAAWGEQDMSSHETPAYLRFFAVTITPLLVLLAAWILFAGSTRTGGAFQAGALLAGTWILLHLAGSAPVRWAGKSMNALLIVGVAAFLVAALAGVVLRGSWLALDPAWAGFAIVAVETALTPAVAVSLAVAFITLGRDPDVAPTEARDEGGGA